MGAILLKTKSWCHSLLAVLACLLPLWGQAQVKQYRSLIVGDWVEVKRTDLNGVSYNERGVHYPASWVIAFDEKGYYHFNTPGHRDSGRLFPYQVVDTLIQSERNYTIQKLDSDWLVMSAVYKPAAGTGFRFYFVRQPHLHKIKPALLMRMQKDNRADTVFLYQCLDRQEPGSAYYFLQAQEMPACPGGRDSMIHYLQRHFYSKGAGGKPRSFTIDLTVEKNGRITDVFSRENIAGQADEMEGNQNGDEKRLSYMVSDMPAWTPARQYGRPARVRMSIDVTLTPAGG